MIKNKDPAKKRKYPVHPDAALFPMLGKDELQEMAEDIRVNGLVHPAVIDANNQLVDGRNRERSCEIAGVECRYEQLPEGTDVKAYIVAANVHRRNLKKGQQAMAVAMLYPDGGVGGRGKRGNPAESAGFSTRRVQEARAVLRHSKAWAEQVLADTMTLDEAVKRIQEAEKAAESDENLLQMLKEEAPDLADLVEEERMKLEEAVAAAEERRAQRVRTQRLVTEKIAGIFHAVNLDGITPRKWATRMVEEFNVDYWPGGGEQQELTVKEMRRCIQALTEFVELYTQQDKGD